MKTRVINLGNVRATLVELDKARAAVLAGNFETFQQTALRAILLMSAAKMADDEGSGFRASRM